MKRKVGPPRASIAGDQDTGLGVKRAEYAFRRCLPCLYGVGQSVGRTVGTELHVLDNAEVGDQWSLGTSFCCIYNYGEPCYAMRPLFHVTFRRICVTGIPFLQRTHVVLIPSKRFGFCFRNCELVGRKRWEMVFFLQKNSALSQRTVAKKRSGS